MIDTIKIYAPITDDIYNKVRNRTEVVKQGINIADDKIIYEVVNDHLLGSYDSSLSVRVCDGAKYGFGSNVIELEGSPHKIYRGQNAFNGFYDFVNCCSFLVGLAEYNYDILLPDLCNFYVSRVDISKCFDLQTRENVKNYIDNFRLLHFPRRKLEHYSSTVYFPGSTTTLKFYDKYADFFVHDMKRIVEYNKNSDFCFDIDNYLNKIKGFVRFECEIKSRCINNMCDMYKIDRCILNFNYDMFLDVFDKEFKKIFKDCDENMNKIYEKNDVHDRLFDYYKPRLANLLYSMYINLVSDGFESTKKDFTKSSFYRNLKYLTDVGVDYTQSNIAYIYKSNAVHLDIFTAKEVA